VFITGFHDELKRELPIMQMLVQEDSNANTVNTETSTLILSCSFILICTVDLLCHKCTEIQCG